MTSQRKRPAASQLPAVDTNVRCPNCDNGGMVPIYAIDQIPVHSTLNMPTRDKALNYPRGGLNLGFCPRCAFVSNTLYDASVQEYNPNCEESQAFSPTFNAFAKSLAERWVERYGIRNKTVLEVGCGKADFLMLLCEAGNNTGIGIDPSCQPERIPAQFKDKVRLIQDHYGEKYSHMTADVVLCRHTLEHIGPTMKFLQSIRRTIGDNKNTLVLFELPDVYRVLKEGAFWDIYYEHCSYFSTGSLARLFRLTGFDVVELEKDYGDQYLLIGAYPADEPTQAKFPLEDDMALMTQTATDFYRTIGATIDGWRKTVRDAVAIGKKVAVWGSLSKGTAFLTTCGFVGDEICCVVDINPYRQNKYMPGTGQKIVAPDALTEYKPDYIVVMNPIYCPEIQKDLDRLGLKAKLLPVGV